MGLLQWALVVLALSLVAGTVGFTGAARGVARTARVFSGVFLTIAFIMLVMVVLGIGTNNTPDF